MKKALIVATVGCFFSFEINDIKILKSMGYEVHCASNFEEYMEHKGVIALKEVGGVTMHHIRFSRSPLKKDTLYAYKSLKKLLQQEQFDLIHCHTPVGGILTRLASKKYRKKGTKLIYTAHGFHFFKGAPITNWLFFYPIEWLCSWWTDLLITINKEDYQRAKKQLHAKKNVYIPGVGIDVNSIYNSNFAHKF